MDKTQLPLTEQPLAAQDVAISDVQNPQIGTASTEHSIVELGSARQAFVLNPTWDAPLNDRELKDLFGQ